MAENENTQLFWLLDKPPYFSEVWIFKTYNAKGNGLYISRQPHPSGVTLRIIESGNWTIKMCGKELQGKRGDVFLTIPSEPVVFSQDNPSCAWEWFEIQFSGPASKRFVQEFGLSKTRPMHTPKSPAQALKVFKMLHKIMGRQDRSEIEIMSWCLRLAMACGRHEEDDVDAALTKGQRLVKRAATILETEASLGLNVNELSFRLGVDRSTLTRAFKTHAGCSPHDFLDSYRLMRVKELLTNTSLGIEGVGKASGFPDLRYFISWFHRKCGTSPGKWRNSGG